MEGHVGSRRSLDAVKNTTVTFLVKYCKEIFQKIINVCQLHVFAVLVLSKDVVPSTGFHPKVTAYLRIISILGK